MSSPTSGGGAPQTAPQIKKKTTSTGPKCRRSARPSKSWLSMIRTSAIPIISETMSAVRLMAKYGFAKSAPQYCGALFHVCGTKSVSVAHSAEEMSDGFADERFADDGPEHDVLEK